MRGIECPCRLQVSVSRSGMYGAPNAKYGPSGSAYVTYRRDDDAERCIQNVHLSLWHGAFLIPWSWKARPPTAASRFFAGPRLCKRRASMVLKSTKVCAGLPGRAPQASSATSCGKGITCRLASDTFTSTPATSGV